LKILHVKGYFLTQLPIFSFLGSDAIIVMQLVLQVNMTSPNSSLTIRITEEEKAMLKIYCKQTTRQQSEVIREFIRSLAKKIKSP
jgi:hypothetical protein